MVDALKYLMDMLKNTENAQKLGSGARKIEYGVQK